MANDILLSSGTGAGATLATDANASSEHFQLIKLVYGLLSSNYQLVSSASPLPVAAASSGLLQLTSGISVSSGTVTLSSNPTVISASSGVVQTLTSGPLVLSSVGLTQALFPVMSSAGFAPVTSSAGQLASLSSGTVTLSSNPTVVSASSGMIQAVVLPVVTSSGLLAAYAYSTGGAAAQLITSAPSALYGYAYFNTSATVRGIKIYNSTGPTVGSTANLLVPLVIPGSTGGGGANLALSIGIAATGGLSVVFTANGNATDTGAPGVANDLLFNAFYMV